MDKRVKNISETVSNQPQDNLKGLRNQLQEISNLFGEIVDFLDDVKDSSSGTVISFLKTLLGKYRRYQKQFKEYTERLHDMREKLDQLITDVIPKVFDLQRLLLAQMQDMQRDMAEMRKLLQQERHKQPKKSNEGGTKGICADLLPPGYPSWEERELGEIEGLLGEVEDEGMKEIECELKALALNEMLRQEEAAKDRIRREQEAMELEKQKQESSS